jgi:probable HAF family extracellular repeat protein
MSAKSLPTKMAILMTSVLAAVVLGSAPAEAQIKQIRFGQYTLTDLGASTIWSFGQAINNSGRAVGDMSEYSGSGQLQRAFRTSANQSISPGSDDLGVLFGDYRSYAYGINSAGVVVGESVHNYPSIYTHAIRYGYNGAGMEDLHPSSLGASESHALGINDDNWIVGYYVKSGYTHSMFSQGVSYSPNSPPVALSSSLEAWMGITPAHSAAYAVNNADQVVGWIKPTVYSQPAAFLFDFAAGVMRLTYIGNLPGGIWSQAYGLNDSGQVVGEASTPNGHHAFLWKDANNNGSTDPGELRDLDTIPNNTSSGARSINSSGTAVGYYGSPDILFGGSRACLFSATGQMTDLNTVIPAGSGWILRMASGINNNGQIVGYMEDQNPDQQSRVRHAFRLDPPPTLVPRYLSFP